MVLLFYNSYTKTFHGEYFSLSFCVTFVFLFFVLFIPFFAGYSTDKFWERLKIYYEHPKVKMRNTYIINVINEDKSNNEKPIQNNFYISNSNFIRDFQGVKIKNPSVSITNHINSNQITEKISFKLTFPIMNLRNIKLFLFYDYYLFEKVKLKMNSMTYIDIDCPFDNSCSKIVANGDLILNQKSPIKVSSIPLGIYYVTEDLLKVDLGESRYDIFYYYNKYNNRNFTTKFKPKDIFYTPGKKDEEENFSIELEMNVPKLQEIMYYDSIYGTLKNTFVQYIFISVFVFYVLWYLLDFILRNRVFYCSIYGDIEADDAINY
jgi:hypothetical protein